MDDSGGTHERDVHETGELGFLCFNLDLVLDDCHRTGKRCGGFDDGGVREDELDSVGNRGDDPWDSVGYGMKAGTG